jgi:hypothetical protein
MNIFDVIGVALPLLSIAVYFFVFWGMNLEFYKSDGLIGIFSRTMSEPQVWLGLLAIAGSVIFTEKAFESWSFASELVSGQGNRTK